MSTFIHVHFNRILVRKDLFMLLHFPKVGETSPFWRRCGRNGQFLKTGYFGVVGEPTFKFKMRLTHFYIPLRLSVPQSLRRTKNNRNKRIDAISSIRSRLSSFIIFIVTWSTSSNSSNQQIQWSSRIVVTCRYLLYCFMPVEP